VDVLLTHLAGLLAALSAPEAAAVVLAVLYLVLAIQQNIWCWVCAAISTAIYVWILFAAKLYMESLLNIFYVGMAIYGWAVWYGGKQHATVPVCRWRIEVHITALLIIAAITGVAGYGLASYTDAALPYLDSLTTVAAVWATFLVARKVLENWWYWLLIDLLSIYLYSRRGLELTSFLFGLYVIMIPFGLWRWTVSYRQQQGIVPA
jgi:nicotinamide mononucleotide transporter